MAAPAAVVTMYFGGTPTVMGTRVRSFDIDRGRSTPLEDIDTGTAHLVLDNRDRNLDPDHAGGIFYGDIRPGVPVEITAGGIMQFAGVVDDWVQAYDSPRGDATTSIVAVDGLGQIAYKNLAEHLAPISQLSGDRVASVLARPEVNFSDYSAEAGVALLQDDFVEEGTNALAYLQLVARSEAGYFYDDQFGVLRFKDRHTTFSSTPAVVFSNDPVANPGSVMFHGAVPVHASDLLANRVVVSRKGGSTETFTDTDSVAFFGNTRTISQTGLLYASDAQSYDLGSYLVGRYAFPTERIASIDVKLHALSTLQQAAVLALDITDVIQVIWTPRGIGLPLSQLLVVEGVSQRRPSAAEHVMTFRLSEAFALATSLFTLDDATLGALTTGSGVLAF